MKQIFTILIVVFVSLSGFSQSIVDFFETIPDSSLLGLNIEERKKIVRYSLDNKSQDDAYKDLSDNNANYAFDVIDVKNGYLRLIGVFEGHMQMCYWNLKNGRKLIAIYFEGCGPVCYIERFDFYEYNGSVFKPINWHSVVPDVYNDFFGDNHEAKIKEMNDKDILATLLFDLPRNGKNIVAKWGNEDSQETYKKYGVGDRMTLIWNDGKFTKGKIYWK